MPRVLHLLSQRPLLTGSGITVDALVRFAAEAGWEQRVVVGVPSNQGRPSVGGLPASRVFPVYFESETLPFPVVGMSDVMPYASTIWSSMNAGELDAYERTWAQHIAEQIAAFEPDIIHSSHLWLMSALVTEQAGEIPVVLHSHATGLRQMSLCPELGTQIQRRMRRVHAILALHPRHAESIRRLYPDASVHIVGAGFRDEIFTLDHKIPRKRHQILYAGKLSHSKGLPWLLEAIDRVICTHPDTTLVIAGSGAGEESEQLEAGIAARAHVEFAGRLSQVELAQAMRESSIFVLPSFYEGLPLVLMEALACGCRLVSTELEVVKTSMADALADVLETVPMPRLESVDQPLPADQPRLVSDLADGLRRALERGPVGEGARERVRDFTWRGVFQKIEALWREQSEGHTS